MRKPTKDADSGPSFAVLPLIQDDDLLRRDFARRGFLCAAGRHVRSSQPKLVPKITCFLGQALSRILRLRSGFRLAARTPPGQLKMYYFAIAF